MSLFLELFDLLPEDEPQPTNPEHIPNDSTATNIKETIFFMQTFFH